MGYSEFFYNININEIKTIFELGSRHLVDAIILSNYFKDSKIYSFECNPDCLIECYKNIYILNDDQKKTYYFN